MVMGYEPASIPASMQGTNAGFGPRESSKNQRAGRRASREDIVQPRGLRGTPRGETPAGRAFPAVATARIVQRGGAKRLRMRVLRRAWAAFCSMHLAEPNRYRAARVAASITKQPASKLRPAFPGRHVHALLRASKPHSLQSSAESPEIASPRSADPDLRARLAATTHELREQLGVAALVQHIAADDAVETPDVGRRRRPRQNDEIDRWNAVQRRVVSQESFGQRMVIAGGDIGAPSFQDEARKCEAAADLENASSVDVRDAHRLRERDRRRPQHTEQRPGRRTNPEPRGAPVPIDVLLPIAQGFQPKRLRAYPHVQKMGFVSRHERPPKYTRAAPRRVKQSAHDALRARHSVHGARLIIARRIRLRSLVTRATLCRTWPNRYLNGPAQ